MMKTIKILVVDDHEMVRKGTILMLHRQSNFHVEEFEARNGNEAYAMVKLNPDLDIILLDINLPDINGMLLTKKILTEKPEAKIIALTSHEEDFIINQMLEAGVMGYLLKNIGVQELTKAIETVYSHEKYFCNEVSQIIISRKNSKIPSYPVNVIDPKGMSKREIEILSMIAQEHSNTEIAEKLNISRRTVDNHRNNILKKTNAKSTISLIKYAINNGLV